MDTPQQFSAALLALAADQATRQAMAQAGLAAVAANRGALERVMALIRERVA